jgi:hypothetical protein
MSSISFYLFYFPAKVAIAERAARGPTSQLKKHTKKLPRKVTDPVSSHSFTFICDQIFKPNRVGPTCKKMVDLTPNKVFKFTAFEPSDEELSNHARALRRGRSQNQNHDPKKRGSNGLVKTRTPSPVKQLTFEERGLDDSDDDLPDVSSMLDVRPSKKAKTKVTKDEDEDDVSYRCIEWMDLIDVLGTG